MITNQKNMQTLLPQISSLKNWNVSVDENKTNLYFNRDANSMNDQRLGLVNGDYLKGSALAVTLTYIGSDFSFIYLPYVNWIPSPRNY
mgnify:FL=1